MVTTEMQEALDETWHVIDQAIALIDGGEITAARKLLDAESSGLGMVERLEVPEAKDERTWALVAMKAMYQRQTVVYKGRSVQLWYRVTDHSAPFMTPEGVIDYIDGAPPSEDTGGQP